MTTQQSFTLAQVLAICEMVAPTATIAEIRKAIASQTAHDEARQSQTRETAPTSSTAKDEPTPSPAIVNPERNDAPKPKKPTRAELAAAYNRIQAYAAQFEFVHTICNNGQDKDAFMRKDGTSDRKWNCLYLSLHKAIETIGGTMVSNAIVFESKAYNAAKKAAKKAAK